MAGSGVKNFGIVFVVGAVAGGFFTLAIQPQPLTAGVNNLSGQKFEELQKQVDLLRTQVDLQNNLLSGVSRGSDGALRFAGTTRMTELIVECPADSSSPNPGLKVCGPAVFESSRMDASRVVLNGNGDTDPAILVSFADESTPRSAVETIGGDVHFINSRVSISADDTLAGPDPLLQVSISQWNLHNDNPLVAVRGGDLQVASGPDLGQVTIAPGEIRATFPSGARAVMGTSEDDAKLELSMSDNGDGPIISRSLLQASGGETPRSSLSADDLTADYIFGRHVQGFDITEIGGTDGPF